MAIMFLLIFSFNEYDVVILLVVEVLSLCLNGFLLFHFRGFLPAFYESLTAYNGLVVSCIKPKDTNVSL